MRAMRPLPLPCKAGEGLGGGGHLCKAGKARPTPLAQGGNPTEFQLFPTKPNGNFHLCRRQQPSFSGRMTIETSRDRRPSTSHARGWQAQEETKCRDGGGRGLIPGEHRHLGRRGQAFRVVPPAAPERRRKMRQPGEPITQLPLYLRGETRSAALVCRRVPDRTYHERAMFSITQRKMGGPSIERR